MCLTDTSARLSRLYWRTQSSSTGKQISPLQVRTKCFRYDRAPHADNSFCLFSLLTSLPIRPLPIYLHSRAATVAKMFDPPEGQAPYSYVFDLTGEVRHDRPEVVSSSVLFPSRVVSWQ